MDAKFEVLATGRKLAEGPVWHGPRDVTFVELGGQRVMRWRDGQLDLVAMTGGAPNGATTIASWPVRRNSLSTLQTLVVTPLTVGRKLSLTTATLMPPQ